MRRHLLLACAAIAPLAASPASAQRATSIADSVPPTASTQPGQGPQGQVPMVPRVPAQGASQQPSGMWMGIYRSGGEPRPGEEPPVVTQYRGNGGQAVAAKTVPGLESVSQIGGLETYLIGPPDGSNFVIVWVTPDGKNFVMGNQLGGDGNPVTEPLRQAILVWAQRNGVTTPQGQPSSAAAPSVAPAFATPTAPASPPVANSFGAVRSDRAALLMNTLPHSAIHLNANAGRRAVLVVDANCGFSKRAWDAVKPLVASGALGLDVVLVDTLESTTRSSVAKGRAILGSPSPDAALAYNFDRFGPGGGAAPADFGMTTNPRTAQTIQTSASVFREAGFQGVPVFFWRDAEGKTWEFPGWPNNPDQIAALLGAMTGRTSVGAAQPAGGTQTVMSTANGMTCGGG